MIETQPIIFSDLDGTLLDHKGYQFCAAESMLRKLKKKRIPLIFCSSKTIWEIKNISEKVGMFNAAISENGAVLHIGESSILGYLKGKPVEFSDDIKKIMLIVNEMPKALRKYVKTVYDFQLSEFCELTGLSEIEARLALRRTYTIPFCFVNDLVPEVAQYFKESGLAIVKGGRFYHLLWAKVSKGRAISWLLKNLKEKYPYMNILSIALGDGENDISMFEAVDRAILIPNANVNFPKDKMSKLRLSVAPFEGPKGWAAALENILFDKG